MATDNNYRVLWSKLVIWLTPVALRFPQLTAFVQALVTPVNWLHAALITFRAFIIYRIGITPQVCYMEKALNDKYDTAMRRITIVDCAEQLPLVLFLKAENKPVKMFTKAEAQPLILYTKGETAQFTVDFVIKVPLAVTFDINEMTALVSSYKMPSKTFKIMIF